jgi:hypothetical protein
MARTTARRKSEVDELAQRIGALGPKEQVRLLRRVLTPDLEFRILLDETRKKTRGVDPRRLDREINKAAREVRKETVAGMRAVREKRETEAAATK